MAASSDLGTQAVIAFDISLRLAVQSQRLRCVQWRAVYHLAVNQPVQEIQHMGLGGHALSQRQLNGGEHGLFIVVLHEGTDIHHFPVTARFAEHVILQLSERRR